MIAKIDAQVERLPEIKGELTGLDEFKQRDEAVAADRIIVTPEKGRHRVLDGNHRAIALVLFHGAATIKVVAPTE